MENYRGAAFLSKLMLEICRLVGTKKAAYHPQTDGLVERFNRTLTDMLAKTVVLTGMKSYHMACSHTGRVFNNLLLNHHSSFFMEEMLDCQLQK